jgi:hypothetical protein
MKNLNVDLDGLNVFELIKSYLHIKKLFVIESIVTELSSSGRGFHLKAILKEDITPEQNFFYRAMIGDDPMRLSLGMRKYFLNHSEKFKDLIFDIKSGEKVQVFDMAALLEPFKEDIDFIMKNWGSQEVSERIEKIANSIRDKIPIVKEVFMTIFAFRSEGLREKILRVCEDTNLRDESFTYRVYESYMPDSDYLFTIFSTSKDQSFMRGQWFLKKVFTPSDLEKIKKFGKEKYYWVKKRVNK